MTGRIFPLAISSLLTAVSLLALQPIRSTQDVGTVVPESCPVTRPPAPAFVPPAPYPNEISPDGFWFGTSGLWTNLPANGIWKGLPHYRPADTAFRNKLFWWRERYTSHLDDQPMLRVTGERLDAVSPPFETDIRASAAWTDDSHHPFIVVGIDIPALGCWKITGKFKDAELTYVVWVAQ